MSDILFIKTSSLGDVIHHMPALTEAKARRPDAHFAWAVEEAIAPLVRLHPAISEVIPVAIRRWRGRRLFAPSTWPEAVQFRRRLRSRRYDLVVDTQGLIKSALVARNAHGVRHGYDSRSIKEPLAAWLYDVRHSVGRDRHAIARNRALTGLALGYEPEGAPDYGLDRARLAGTAIGPAYGVLLHATAGAGKQWPIERWRAIASQLSERFPLILPWGNTAEHNQAKQIAHGIPQARVPDLRPLDEVARLIAGASFVVGVDTGLVHLAAALGVPLLAIFSGSEPRLTGPMGPGVIRVLGANGAAPGVEEVVRAALEVIA